MSYQTAAFHITDRAQAVLQVVQNAPRPVIASVVAPVLQPFYPLANDRELNRIASDLLGDLYRTQALDREANTGYPESNSRYQYFLSDDGLAHERQVPPPLNEARVPACEPVIEKGWLDAMAAAATPDDGLTLRLNDRSRAVLRETVQAEIEMCASTVQSSTEHYDDVLTAAQRLSVLVELRQQLRDLED